MNWSEIFPVLDEGYLESYSEGVTEAEAERFEEWFGVSRFFRSERTLRDAGKARHILSITAFWKHVGADDPDLPVPTRERLVLAKRKGLVRRLDPWATYFEPALYDARLAMEKHPDVEFRVYLASDLDFLVGDFLAAGWDVALMKSPSIRYCPGGFWRFLALEEDALVTMVDADRLAWASVEIERTLAMSELGLGLWRIPGYYNQEPREQVRYRPLLGGHFGALGGIPVRDLIQAFIWHADRKSLELSANVPGYGRRPLMFGRWPGYGYDEIFQLVALYPWLVSGGVLSFVPSDARSIFLPADIEYATHANPKSEIVYV